MEKLLWGNFHFFPLFPGRRADRARGGSAPIAGIRASSAADEGRQGWRPTRSPERVACEAAGRRADNVLSAP